MRGDHFSLKIKPNGKEMTEFDGILAELQCEREASFRYSYLRNLRFRVGAICFFGSKGRSRTRAGFADRTEVVGGDRPSLHR
jgi:hypothetical protein